jgi:hypothetical protein
MAWTSHGQACENAFQIGMTRPVKEALGEAEEEFPGMGAALLNRTATGCVKGDYTLF